ncbi:MAG TPA: hypothetical protein VIK78_14475 [Ruminiclostridium sp.]
MKVSKEEAQKAWNIVARYLNQQAQLSYHIDPWNNKNANRYTVNYIKDNKTIDLFVASARWRIDKTNNV